MAMTTGVPMVSALSGQHAAAAIIVLLPPLGRTPWQRVELAAGLCPPKRRRYNCSRLWSDSLACARHCICLSMQHAVAVLWDPSQRQRRRMTE